MESITRRNLVKAAIAGGALIATSGIAAQAAHAEQAETGQAAHLHRGYVAAHGDKSFTQVVVALDEAGTILAADIDEYQFMDSATEGLSPVPNAAGMGANFVEGVTLVSKADNNDVYSAAMAEKGGATQTWLDSIAAIEDFAAGKTADELGGVDTVAGCTLTSAPDYLAAIAAVAQDDTLVAHGSGNLADVALGRATFAAHGGKGFASAVTLVSAGQIVAASIDEFQCMSADTEGLVPVPNSDGAFGENIVEGMELGSKSLNDASYSAHMAEKAGATLSWLTSIDAIEDSLVGQRVDAISGATLVDARAYAFAAVKAGMKA